MIKKLLDFIAIPLAYLWKQVDRTHAIRREHFEIVQNMKQTLPDNPALKGFKVYSQFDEDGIIQEILDRISSISKPNLRAIEIGCGRGLENNTHFLLLKGYSCIWVDGAPDNCKYIRDELGAGADSSRLQVLQLFVDKDNIVTFVESAVERMGLIDPDFFSLDIDGNDLEVLKNAMKRLKPKVICVEYNPKFPPPVSLSIEYNPAHVFNGTDYHGASLQAFVNALPTYRLVSCSISGANAFFVRNDLATVFATYPITELYQPCRYDMAYLRSGHLPTLRWLRNEINKNIN